MAPIFGQSSYGSTYEQFSTYGSTLDFFRGKKRVCWFRFNLRKKFFSFLKKGNQNTCFFAKKLWTFFFMGKIVECSFFSAGQTQSLQRNDFWCVRVQWMLLSGCLEEVWGRNKCHFSHSAECDRAGLSAYLLIRVSFEQRQHNPDMTLLRIASRRWRSIYI